MAYFSPPYPERFFTDKAMVQKNPDPQLRRRKLGQIYLYRRNFTGGFYKQRHEISPVRRKMGYSSPPDPQHIFKWNEEKKCQLICK